MLNKRDFTFLIVILARLIVPANAQTTTPPAVKTQPTIGQRMENQQDRIANGINSGQLTVGEAATLEGDESKLNHEVRDMRVEDGGKLSAADTAKVESQQNALSKQIYLDKHNATVQNTNPTSEVDKRLENQQDRIAQGVQSGQLTASEAANLEKKDAAINREVDGMRAANGGKLTQSEKVKVNRQESRVSRQIFRDKHNGRRQR